MNKPRIETTPGSYRYIWEEYHLAVTATRVREHRDGRTTAELLFESTAPGVPRHLHGPTQTNLISTRGRSIVAKALQERYTTLSKEEWGAIMEAVCVYVLRDVRMGEPVVTLSTENPIATPQWALYPLIPKDLPTLIYGRGGSGKSILAMSWLICLQADWQDNPWGLRPWPGGMRGIYLDWELDRNENEYRLQCLAGGHDLGIVGVRYRRCSVPLADDLEPIRQALTDDEAQFIVIDSVFGAAGGDLNATDVASRFFAALRKLPVTSLLIAHPNKNGETDGPLGSVMYVNQVRSMWEVSKVQDVGTDEIEVGLFHRKANTSRLQKPMGYRIRFAEDTIMIDYADPAENAILAEKVQLRLRIIGHLRRGPKHNRELCDLMPDAKPDSITKTTGRMHKAGVITVGPASRYALTERCRTEPGQVSADKADKCPRTKGQDNPPYIGGCPSVSVREDVGEETEATGSPQWGRKPGEPF